MMKSENLVGTYELLSWENRHASGETSYPLGPDAQGYINYTPDGYMFVHIMAANRKAYSSGDLFGGETSEVVDGANSHLSYCGTYRIENNEVVHTVNISSFPNWILTEQRRHFEFKNGKLFLSVQGLKIGNESVGAYLIWQPLQKRGAT
jgi:hypothetical protein